MTKDAAIGLSTVDGWQFWNLSFALYPPIALYLECRKGQRRWIRVAITARAFPASDGHFKQYSMCSRHVRVHVSTFAIRRDADREQDARVILSARWTLNDRAIRRNSSRHPVVGSNSRSKSRSTISRRGGVITATWAVQMISPRRKHTRKTGHVITFSFPLLGPPTPPPSECLRA